MELALAAPRRPDAVSRVGARLHLIIMHGQRVRQTLLAVEVGFACQVNVVKYHDP